jgi:hypothetical protein
MEDLSKRNVTILDNGLFVSLAEHLAPHFNKVRYATPTAGPFTTTPEYSIGMGIEGVQRLDDITSALHPRIFEDTDLWVFPDVYLSGLVSHLRAMGLCVWGSGDAEMFELDRLKFKQHAEKLGLDLGRYETVKGMVALRSFMKAHPGWFLKTSRQGPPGRGDFETVRSRSYSEVEFRLDEIAARLGHRAESTEFILEEPIEDAVEIATDVYCIDGEYPSKGLLGLEIKAEGYVAKVIDYDDYPESLREVNEAMAPTFKRSKYRSMAAIECRLTKDGTAYVLDPCLRFGRPPLSVQAVITNWPEIFWGGGNGELVEPEFGSPWCAEACIYSDYAEEHPTRIEFPEDLAAEHLKLSNYCIDKGKRIVVPQNYKLSGLGSVIATGSTMAKAIANCRDLMKELKGYDVKASDPFDQAEEEIAKMKSFGVDGFG